MAKLREADDGTRRERGPKNVVKTAHRKTRIDSLMRIMEAGFKEGRSFDEIRQMSHRYLILSYDLSTSSRDDYIKTAFILLSRKEEYQKVILENVPL